MTTIGLMYIVSRKLVFWKKTIFGKLNMAADASIIHRWRSAHHR